jgi:23S rRNA (cytidine1920-2'-O)/16S rRNA (cytidine1409-2'-O)-methyltransferase
MAGKKRLDQLIVDKELIESREKAKRIIMAGQVQVDGRITDKPGTKIKDDSEIKIIGEKLKYVGRGGLKLEKAIQAFNLVLDDKIVVDIGASTGGFTDCALQNGAKKIYAVDVGYGQLDWKLRQDERVVCIERKNARYLTAADINNDIADFVSIDVSFISLRKILPAVINVLKKEGEIAALIKPQFEAGKEQVGKKGIVNDKFIHKEVIINVIDCAADLNLYPSGISYSPIKGGTGNIEFLILLKNEETASVKTLYVDDKKIEETIKEAHEKL